MSGLRVAKQQSIFLCERQRALMTLTPLSIFLQASAIHWWLVGLNLTPKPKQFSRKIN
jgi:hypothetical protein